MHKVALVAALLGAGTTTGAYGQPAPTANYTSFEAEPGKPVQLGFYGQAHKDCTTAKMPVVRVADAPNLGTLTVRPSELKTDRVPNCPGLKIPAQVVTYQARESGDDHLMYSVTYPNGEIAL